MRYKPNPTFDAVARPMLSGVGGPIDVDIPALVAAAERRGLPVWLRGGPVVRSLADLEEETRLA